MNARQLASLFRFRFRTLFIAVALVALSVTALIQASAAWSHDLRCAAIVLLTLAIPLACYRSGEQRAFWAGFALCGWVYLLLVGNLDDRSQTEWNNAARGGPSANLPTSRLTYWIYTTSYGDPAEQAEPAAFRQRQGYLASPFLSASRDAAASPTAPAANPAASVGRPRPDWWHFLNVGHALWTILIACVGGGVVRGIYILRPEK